MQNSPAPFERSTGSSLDTYQHRGTDLADVLERVLDKGVVVAGDIAINLLDIELLTIKLRLLIASADKAKELGVDWWTHDPFLSSKAAELNRGDGDPRALRKRVESLEETLRALQPGQPDQPETPSPESGSRERDEPGSGR